MPLYQFFCIGDRLDLSGVHCNERSGYHLFSGHDKELSVSDVFEILECFRQRKKIEKNFLGSKKRCSLEINYSNDKSYHVKEYPTHGISRKLVVKRSLRISSAVKSLIASVILRKLEVGTPRAEYAIEKRKGLLLVESFLITRFIKNAHPLDRYVYRYLPKKRRKDFFKDLAWFVSHLHESGISHGDMFRNNVLVKEKNEGWDIFLVDLDTVAYKNLGAEDRVEDLAQLNYALTSMREVSIKERLYFFSQYMITSKNFGPSNRHLLRPLINSIRDKSLTIADRYGKFVWTQMTFIIVANYRVFCCIDEIA
jgi:tRNA A-37 threonylcarbamoyl transferase component Bud32